MSEHLIDSFTSGVKTTEEIEAQPYGFRVSWIRWDSGFRGSGLRIGDRVIALDGVPYRVDERKRTAHKAFGSYSEDQHWAASGAKDGQRAVVTALRGSETVEISGRILAKRSWRDADGKGTIGPDGPRALATDGFDSVWSAWLERFEDTGSRVLDGGWRRGTISSSREMLAAVLREKPRIDALCEKHPGPFATATAADWAAILDCLQGRRYEIRPEDLAWRNLGEEHRGRIAAAAKAAREAFVAAVAAETIPPFPAVDPIRGDRAAVAGKVVVLPPIGNRGWVMDGGKAFLVAGDSRQGFYFVDSTAPAMQRALDAGWRYQKAVTPNLSEVHAVIGRIGPDPKMLVREGNAIAGLALEPIADSFGDQLFVDLTRQVEGRSPFAGEDSLGDASEKPPADDAPPEAVMAAFVHALKVGAEATWKALFATWEALLWDGRPWFKPVSLPAASRLASEWVSARRLLQQRVCDVRVVAVDPTTTVLHGTEFPGAPRIEQAVVEVDHVGLFDGEYRVFKDMNVNRLWTLQRRDAGPWRVTTQRGI